MNDSPRRQKFPQGRLQRNTASTSVVLTRFPLRTLSYDSVPNSQRRVQPLADFADVRFDLVGRRFSSWRRRHRADTHISDRLARSRS
uniref:Uncharacterized protein n=1 Tax=Steinernema glaseri TaxID=37863 RepID=A0A1I7Z5Q7_9BILA